MQADNRGDLDPAQKARLDAPLQLFRIDGEAAGESGRRVSARELEQRQRVAARLRDDPVADAVVEPPMPVEASNSRASA